MTSITTIPSLFIVNAENHKSKMRKMMYSKSTVIAVEGGSIKAVLNTPILTKNTSARAVRITTSTGELYLCLNLSIK